MPGTALAVETFETPSAPKPTDDPLATRWYINTVEREARVPSHECGFQVVRYGEWGAMQVFSVPQEVHTVDESKPREELRQHSALEVQRELEYRFAGRDLFGNPAPNKPNKGLKVSFFGVTDAAKMKVISETVLPTLPRIREIAEELKLGSPIGTVCDGQDDLDFGERATCPTCWLAWLQSPVSDAYLERVALTGRDVFDAQNPDQKWVVRPTIEEMREAKNQTIESLKTGIGYLQNTWRTIVAEIEGGKRNSLDEGNFQHTIRKDIHQVKPEQREMMLIKEAAKANQNVGGNDAVIAMLAKGQLQTNALLEKLVEKGALVEAPAPHVQPPNEPETPDDITDDLTAGFQDAETKRKGRPAKQ